MSKSNDTRRSTRDGLTREQRSTFVMLKAFYEEQPRRMWSQRINLHLNRLVREAGIKNAALTASLTPHRAYAEAIKIITARGDEHSPLDLLDYKVRAAVEFWYGNRDGAKAKKEKPAAGTRITFSMVELKRDDDSWKHVGVMPGEVVHVAPETSPRPRQILVMYRHAGMLDGVLWGAGRFVRFEPFLDDETGETSLGIVLEDEDDSGRYEQSYPLTTWTALRIVKIEPTAHPHADKIAKLQQRLAEIDADDITDSTARFNIEREIFKLENEPTPADEWEGFDLILEGGKDR
jgi:hypothetical protein